MSSSRDYPSQGKKMRLLNAESDDVIFIIPSSDFSASGSSNEMTLSEFFCLLIITSGHSCLVKRMHKAFRIIIKYCIMNRSRPVITAVSSCNCANCRLSGEYACRPDPKRGNLPRLEFLDRKPTRPKRNINALLDDIQSKLHLCDDDAVDDSFRIIVKESCTKKNKSFTHIHTFGSVWLAFIFCSRPRLHVFMCWETLSNF